MGADTGRLRWVMWLLSAAIVVPSMGLLWLINHGLESERLVVRKRLEETYQHLGARAEEEVTDLWRRTLVRYETLTLMSILEDVPDGLPADGVMLLDTGGRIQFPRRSQEDRWGRQISDNPIFAYAWRQEFTEKDELAAAAQYQRIGDRQDDVSLRLAGRAAAVRCLAKGGEPAAAVDLAAATLREVDLDGGDAVARGLGLRLRLSHAELLAREDPPAGAEAFVALLNLLLDPGRPCIPDTDRILVLRRALTRHEALGGESGLTARARKQLAAESLAAGQFPGSNDASSVLSHSPGVLFSLEGTVPAYGVRVHREDGAALFLFTEESIISSIFAVASDLLPPELTLHVTAPRHTSDSELVGVRMVQQNLAPMFPGWLLLGYAETDQALDAAARRQTAVYAWTGILVLGLLVVAGATSIQLVSREIRFHRLKNDFVATVTHELKTPLASTRVLVDTLLDNGGEDRCQRTEYLEMIAKENARLAGLIDRFLTFSRMERGKHGVDPEPCDPGLLVERAVEAVQMHCRDATEIEVAIQDGLPAILADPDALVTVLVNLLDNAMKYSGPDKRIRIGCRLDDREVRFAVTDNGMGIPTRARKRVFNKFYQVDQSLSRSTGGCGLGLSIVDYLVRQHHGRVEIDSKVGVGSTFTVALPIHLETS